MRSLCLHIREEKTKFRGINTYLKRKVFREGWPFHIVAKQFRLWIFILVEASWKVMTHAQEPDLVFRRNGRVHLYRRGPQFRGLLAAEVCASAVVMLDTSCVKGTGYPLHSPVSPSLPLPCVTLCHHISTGVYYKLKSLLCTPLRQFYFHSFLS
jgi:hypothetical protein